MQITPCIQLVYSILISLIFLSSCNKKTRLVEETVEEPITHERTDRDDIPPPPLEAWWTIDLNKLSSCQQRLWSRLKYFYPIPKNNNHQYQLYTLKHQPTSVYSFNNVYYPLEGFFNETFPNQYLYNQAYNCEEELSPSFFIEALGQASCTVQNNIDKLTTYFYYIKLRFRFGPCPFTHYQGEAIGNHCGPIQNQYCSMLKIVFSMETNKLVYIDLAI